ncbi:alpha/beta hydrolase fold domain-containing protein [Staphylococcus petrasii]|uniref:alpha/beta hydrolase fold domain-containing protein n=1 Tax=Staphylococcus petrasii TaxID=1276936 RepID=UPI000CD1A96B|nr:alpha/beta hydrolase [Staphylococcus petrasii]PNZ84379.1 esterase [Staphylococcus petrasii]TGA81803.1 alpha/beta hydrolase [Staphylococcus petrasii]
MRSHMVNRIINKYLLHNRSILFDNEAAFDQFMERRKDANQAKHKQPSTLNVKANLDKLSLGDMQVFRFNFRHETKKKILYIHGGYNTLQPSPFHWRFMDKLVLNTLYEVVLPIYPKTPEYHIEDTFKAINDVYDSLLEEVDAHNIVIMGDGTGGALALSFVQQLIEQQRPVPKKLFLISPMLDATMTNPQITDNLINKDRFVNIDGLQRILNVWSHGDALANPRISPLYGSLEHLPPIVMFGGGREIYYPDIQQLAYKLEEANQDIQFFDYPKMFHDFPLYPIRESHKVIKQITKTIDQ